MGCNSSKDGSNPSQSAQGGDSAPKDKPEDGNAQQTSATHEDASTPADDKNPNGDAVDDVEEISDDSDAEENESKTKYELPSENGDSEDRKESRRNTLEDEGESPDITRNMFSVTQDGNRIARDDESELERHSSTEPQQTGGGEESATEQQAKES